jgi:oligopeptidase B
MMNIPKAKKKPHIHSKHNHERIDDYFWMRDRENPEVIEYLNSENAYAEEVMSDCKKLREDLFSEIVSRIKKDDSSVPFLKKGFWYYTRFEGESEYPVFCRKKDIDGALEEIMLDVNELAKGKKYCQVGGISISPDNKMMAYGVDFVSRRLYTIFFKNLETGKLFDVQIPGTTGGLTWANDNKTVYYSLKDEETLRSYRIIRRNLGTPLQDDKEIFIEKDEAFDASIYKTKSEKYLFIETSSSTSSELRYLEANNPFGEFRIFNVREKDHEYSVSHFGNEFQILTNWKAKNFRLMKTPEGKTEKKNWIEMIAHRPDVLLEDTEIFDDYLVLSERKNGLILLKIIDQKTKKEAYLDFGEEVYVADISVNPEFDSEWLRYSYSSLTTPPSVIDYNMKTGEKIVKKQQEVIGSFKASDYKAERLWAPARDGKKIPISIVYRKKFVKDGNAPMMLYGYGSYGITVEPGFSSVRLSLLDRGFSFAIAHIRGGEELGREWYDDGKMLKKKNTFFDFIDCAEFLIKEKYTSSEKMIAKGGSAGGLLIGAVMNMRPDIFKGMIASVPFVDVITTMLDDSIPLTTGEYEEWGNPNEKEYYDYMLSYSPYDNVEKKDYPALLVTTGLHDSQVQYWEPAKWVAKLRELKTDQNLLLMHINMDVGHGGASGRFEVFRETALEYAFSLKLLNHGKF